MRRSLQGRFSQLWRFPGQALEGPLPPDPHPPPGTWLQLQSRVHAYTRYKEVLEVWGRMAPQATPQPQVSEEEEIRFFSWEGAERTPMPSVYRKIFREWSLLTRQGLDQ